MVGHISCRGRWFVSGKLIKQPPPEMYSERLNPIPGSKSTFHIFNVIVRGLSADIELLADFCVG